MNIQLSDKEILYLYGNLKKELKELETAKHKSLFKADIHLHQSIIERWGNRRNRKEESGTNRHT